MKHKETKQLQGKPKAHYKIMSVSVSSGAVGMVMFNNKNLTVLKTSAEAAKSMEKAKQQMMKWIDKYNPDCIVTEKLDERSRKHGRTPELIDAIAEAIQAKPILHVEVTRQYDQKNKYDEAKELSGRYPLLGKYLPSKRNIWQSEDRRMMLFEAVSNAEQII